MLVRVPIDQGVSREQTGTVAPHDFKTCVLQSGQTHAASLHWCQESFLCLRVKIFKGVSLLGYVSAQLSSAFIALHRIALPCFALLVCFVLCCVVLLCFVAVLCVCVCVLCCVLFVCFLLACLLVCLFVCLFVCLYIPFGTRMFS